MVKRPSKKAKTNPKGDTAASENSRVNLDQTVTGDTPFLDGLRDDADSSISKAYQECFEGGSLDERQLALSRYEREGFVATTLWPFLLSQHKDASNVTDLKANHNKQQTYQVSRLLVVLVSFSNSIAGKKAEQALECMLRADRDSDVSSYALTWKALLVTVCGPAAYPNQIASDGSSASSFDWEYLASVTHFLSLACQLSEQNHGSLKLEQILESYDSSHISVLSCLSSRQRELLLRQNEGWLAEYDQLEKQNGDDGEDEGNFSKKKNQPCFVVRNIRHLLHLVQGDSLKMGKIHYGNGSTGPTEEDESPGGDDEDEIVPVDMVDKDEEEQEREEANHARVVVAQYKFIHHCLELLLDMINNLRRRRYLAPYLRGINFCLLMRRALVGTGPLSRRTDLDSFRLTQQLVNRLQLALRIYTTTTGCDPLEFPYGKVMNRVQQVSLLHTRASLVQKLCHRYYSEQLADLIYAGVGLLCREPGDFDDDDTMNHFNSTIPSFLASSLGALDDAQLLDLVQTKLRLIGESQDDATTYNGNGGPDTYSRGFILQVLEEFLTYPVDPSRRWHLLPLYPTEELLWDPARIPPSLPSMISTSSVLACPKLSTQFLSSQDYLSRNFALTQASTAYDIRSDLVHVVSRVRPIAAAPTLEDLDENDNNSSSLTTSFTGWARMALELDKPLELVRVEKLRLNLGKQPSRVLADFTVDLTPCGTAIRREWDSLGEFDNLLLIAVDATRMTSAPAPLLQDYDMHHGGKRRGGDQRRRVPDEDDHTFPRRYGVVMVRGCQIVHVRDESGSILGGAMSSNEPANGNRKDEVAFVTELKGTKRIFRVELDTAQYAMDASETPGGASESYRAFNLVVRRDSRENNFKAVLETIRDLMVGTDVKGGSMIGRVIPTWLESLLLGQGDPAAANYKSDNMQRYAKETVGMSTREDLLDFGDTFISEQHLLSSFPSLKIAAVVSEDTQRARNNYRIRASESNGKLDVEAIPYPFPNGKPGNQVPFTPVQVEAIRSGLSPGLTIVVGPPGTGKTDVAVQVISCLFHSFPTQRTIVITHSNAALNDIFQKVMRRGDLDERFLVRLGAGERDLQTDSTHDFTKAGRVNYSLAQRGKLLEEVQLLSESLGLSGRAERGADGAPSYTCETALYFREHNILKLIRSFEHRVQKQEISLGGDVSSFFPFSNYFQIKVGQTVTLSQAREFVGRLQAIFDELNEYRPFELLRSNKQRSEYLIAKQARVVAMTCTHAAIARSSLIKLGFEYDNVVIEEAGQMTDIETFIPFLLQKGEATTTTDGRSSPSSSRSSSLSSRLKRVCLMGDHNQLPPVIKNMSLAQYSNLDQSLFARLIRFGVPRIQLDKQGRARPEIANLYTWRYDNLGNLRHVAEATTYRLANPGFVHTFQAIHVDQYQGRGESTPTAYYFQNVGEAEYAVALFQYMVMIGYSPNKISILTTYNGQRALICDILNQRCGEGSPLSGVQPRVVSTVDQYQGQQNDYIILSLVRTESVGHLRDIRRLVVAVSRARLGLYVLCRTNLFASHHDLEKTFGQFMKRPTKLQLLVEETFPTERLHDSEIPKEKIFEIDDVTHLGSLVHQMQHDMIQQRSQAQTA